MRKICIAMNEGGKPWAGHSAIETQSEKARRATARKFPGRYGYKPVESENLTDHEFTQQVGFRTRIARQIMMEVLTNESVARDAHENPKLAHHNGPHADRVEHTLQSLILNTLTDEQKRTLEKLPVILGGVFLFPRGHDFLHQVLTAQRNIDEAEPNHNDKLNAKRGHDIAAGVIMRGQTAEYEKVLREAYKALSGITDDSIKQEALVMGIIGQIISSPHGFPGNYEGVIGQQEKDHKAYTSSIDEATGEEKRIPREYRTEKDARSLAEDYRQGKIDPFSLNQAQMIAIMTYEVSHPTNPKNKVVNHDDMSTYVYGIYPHGLHPAMRGRYGDTLTEMAMDERFFEDLLPKEIMDQRSLIEQLGKLALLADTLDLVADPTGRVVRSLLTQKTFTGDNPRPVFPHGLKESDIAGLLDHVETSDGEDWKSGAHNTVGYSLLRRLDWEIRHWYPFKDVFHDDIRNLRGEISIMAQLEQFRIIRAWMSSDPDEWDKALDSFYTERVGNYEDKLARRKPGSVHDASWLHEERAEVMDLLHKLRNNDEYTDEDHRIFQLYEKESLSRMQRQYGMSDEQMARLRKLSEEGKTYQSAYIKSTYDVTYSTGIPPLRGLEPNTT